MNADLERLKYIYRPREKAGEFWDQRSFHPLNAAIWFQESQFQDHLLEIVSKNFNEAEIPSLKVLEVGCGWGRNLPFFLQWGIPPSQIFGIDLMKHFIDYGNSIFPQLQIEVGDATQMRFSDRSFDIVFCHTVLSALLDKDLQVKILQEMKRLLKPGGILIAHDIVKNYPDGKVVDELKGEVVFIRAYDPKIFDETLNEGFAKVYDRTLGLKPRARHILLNGIFRLVLRKMGFGKNLSGETFSGKKTWMAFVSKLCPSLRSHFIVGYKRLRTDIC